MRSRFLILATLVFSLSSISYGWVGVFEIKSKVEQSLHDAGTSLLELDRAMVKGFHLADGMPLPLTYDVAPVAVFVDKVLNSEIHLALKREGYSPVEASGDIIIPLKDRAISQISAALLYRTKSGATTRVEFRGLESVSVIRHLSFEDKDWETTPVSALTMNESLFDQITMAIDASPADKSMSTTAKRNYSVIELALPLIDKKMSEKSKKQTYQTGRADYVRIVRHYENNAGVELGEGHFLVRISADRKSAKLAYDAVVQGGRSFDYDSLIEKIASFK